jgi:cytochrome c oxidase subunit II
MEKILIAISLILLAVIAYLIFRLTHSVIIIKKIGEDKGKQTSRINAVLLPVFFVAGMSLIIWYSLTGSQRNYFRDAASVHGGWIDTMFWITLFITGAVFLATQFMLFYFPYRYRHQEGKPALYYPNNLKLEFFWTLIPFITFIALFHFSSVVWEKITSSPPQKAVNIEIMAEQFNWRVRYPGADNKFGNHLFSLISEENDFGIDRDDPASMDDFAPTQLHIPKGKPVLFKIRSRDVIHSVYIPQFRLKMDAVPGMPTRFHFIPVYTTQEMRDKLQDPNFNYELSCAELCGRSHFAMLLIVVVDEEEDFKKWYSMQKPMIAKTAMAADQDQ